MIDEYKGELDFPEPFLIGKIYKGGTLRGEINSRFLPTIINNPVSGSVATIWEPHYLTENQIATKRIILSEIPVYNSISLLPDGGLPQRNLIDFRYNAADNSITWDGLGLDGYLEIGELVELYYLIYN